MAIAKVSMHNHSNFSDGKVSPEEMLLRAIKDGFTHYTFSDHSYNDIFWQWGAMTPDKYESYLETCYYLKDKYKDKINAFVTMEAEYLPDKGLRAAGLENYMDRFDYILTGLHFGGRNGIYFGVDDAYDIYEPGIRDAYGSNACEMVEEYFKNYIEMIKTIKPHLAAHFDLVKKNNVDNKYFDMNSKWYKDLVTDALDEIKKTNVVMEVNTGGLDRYGERGSYPENWVIKEMHDRGIPMTISADAHFPDSIGKYYEMARKSLKNAGYEKIAVFNGMQFVPMDF